MGLPTTLLGLGLQLRADADAARRQHVATLAGRLGYESVWFHAAPGDAGVLDEIGAMLAAGVTRVGAVFTRRVGVALGVSIGRTMSEAQARVARDPFLAGTGVCEAGLFGPFEQAQEQVLALAAAGVDWIRADLADEQDIADLLAQLRAAAVGPVHVLHDRGR